MKYSAALAVAVALGLCAGTNAQANEPSQNNLPQQEMKGQEGQKTVGAMQNETGNKATSPEDVRRQTEGQPTMQQQALKGKTQPGNSNPTEYSPGTVGASPGSDQPTPKKEK